MRGVAPGALTFPKGLGVVRALRGAAADGTLSPECGQAWLDAGVYEDEVYVKLLVPLPDDPGERALARVQIFRFDDLSRPYYSLRRGDDGARVKLDAQLARLDALLEAQPFLTGREFGLADVAYVPWILRARDRMGVELDQFPTLEGWVERLAERPSIAAEIDVVAAQ